MYERAVIHGHVPVNEDYSQFQTRCCIDHCYFQHQDGPGVVSDLMNCLATLLKSLESDQLFVCLCVLKYSFCIFSILRVCVCVCVCVCEVTTWVYG